MCRIMMLVFCFLLEFVDCLIIAVDIPEEYRSNIKGKEERYGGKDTGFGAREFCFSPGM